jgi:hypothetical protein
MFAIRTQYSSNGAYWWVRDHTNNWLSPTDEKHRAKRFWNRAAAQAVIDSYHSDPTIALAVTIEIKLCLPILSRLRHRFY